jgi:flagellar motility protein MotE (MotC chaperone)
MKILLLCLLFTTSTFAAIAKPVKGKTPATPATTEPEKKSYTEDEFRKAVREEAEKLMKRAGSGNLVDFSKELLEKEDTLKMKEQDIKKQDEQLKMNMTDFQKKVIEFQDSQKKFLTCVDGQNEKSEKRVSQMVEVISGMKPQSAADVLAIQDPELSVRILSLLDSQKTSKIFNLMDKEVSARLQKQFLQMKK